MITKIILLCAPEKTGQQLHLWGQYLQTVAASNRKKKAKVRGCLEAGECSELSEEPSPLNAGHE
jgi:hypothetical protein